jgi:DNA polymerase-4
LRVCGHPRSNGDAQSEVCCFEIISRSRSVSTVIANRGDLAHLAIGLLEDNIPFPKAVRLLGVSLSSLQGEDDAEPQLDFGI